MDEGTNKSKELTFEKDVQHTPDEIMDELGRTMKMAVDRGIFTKATGLTMLEIGRELIHWMFLKPGDHAAPSELVAKAPVMTMDDYGTDTLDTMIPGGRKPKLDA